jgi:hypothetical protein
MSEPFILTNENDIRDAFKARVLLKKLLDAVEEHRNETCIELNDWPADTKLWAVLDEVKKEVNNGSS